MLDKIFFKSSNIIPSVCLCCSKGFWYETGPWLQRDSFKYCMSLALLPAWTCTYRYIGLTGRGLLNKIGSSALWTSCRNSHRLIQEMKWIQWHCDLWTVKLATSFSFRTLQSMPLFFSVRSIYQVLVELVELSSKVAVLELSVLLLHDWLKRPIKWKMQRCHPSQPKRK